MKIGNLVVDENGDYKLTEEGKSGNSRAVLNMDEGDLYELNDAQRESIRAGAELEKTTAEATIKTFVGGEFDTITTNARNSADLAFNNGYEFTAFDPDGIRRTYLGINGSTVGLNRAIKRTGSSWKKPLAEEKFKSIAAGNPLTIDGSGFGVYDKKSLTNLAVGKIPSWFLGGQDKELKNNPSLLIERMLDSKPLDDIGVGYFPSSNGKLTIPNLAYMQKRLCAFNSTYYISTKWNNVY